MSNPLIKQSLDLGGVKVWEPSGTIRLQKKSTKGAWIGKTVVIELAFYSSEELGKAVEWAIANGYEPSETPTVTPTAAQFAQQIVGIAPPCPIHGEPMKPSTKGKGYYCSKKMPDGTFCKQKA